MTGHRVLITGPDADGLGDELAAAGADVVRLEGIVSAEALTDAGIEETDLLVLTDLSEATGIPVAKELHPAVKIVVYSSDSLPEFARGQADLAVDPALLGPDVVAAELLGRDA
ncbi:DUF7126 family protein [Haloferacaceae archaeon DSL9]